MRVPRGVVSMLCLSLIGCWGTQAAEALEVHGRSSTQYSWYNDIVDGSGKSDLSEYLRFSMTADDSANKVSLQGYGRAVWGVNEGETVEDRLYYLFVDVPGLADTADVRVGRQFVNLSAGSALIDGVQADFNRMGWIGVSLMGGRDIQFSERGTISAHTSVGGAALYLVGFKNTDLDVSYYRAYDYSDVTRDIVGFNFKQFLLDSVKVYANARYDLTSEVFSEALGGIKYFPILDLMLTAEYYESYPTFDTISIYSVFAVEKYHEALVRAEYTATPWLELSAGYIKETFDDDGENSDIDVIEAGVRLRPTRTVTIGLYRDSQRGYGGVLAGYRTYAEYSNFRTFKVGGGIDYDEYRRDGMVGGEIARKYWAATRYSFARNMSASLRVEDNVNANYSKDLRGRATFDLDF